MDLRASFCLHLCIIIIFYRTLMYVNRQNIHRISLKVTIMYVLAVTIFLPQRAASAAAKPGGFLA